MSTYKITNITNLAGKRDFKFNSELDIDYVDNMTRKTLKVKPGNSVYLTVATLPLSVHRLRVKNLIAVEEVSAIELAQLMKQSQPVKSKVKKEVEKETGEESFEEHTKKGAKKKFVKKDEE
jgi:hypothetical protein